MVINLAGGLSATWSYVVDYSTKGGRKQLSIQIDILNVYLSTGSPDAFMLEKTDPIMTTSTGNKNATSSCRRQHLLLGINFD